MAKAAKSNSPKTQPSLASVVQLWYGEDQAMLDLELMRWLMEFRKKYPSASVTKVEYDKGKEPEVAQGFHQAVWGGGLFADKRLVVARNLFKAESKGELAAEVKALLEAPADGSIVVLVEGAKLTWSKPLLKSLKEDTSGLVTIREFAPLSDLELERWVTARAKQEGGSLAPGVARLLVARVGGNVQVLAQEVAKLTSYRGKNDVTVADLDKLVTPMLRDDVFAILDAVGRHDLVAASAALSNQFSLGTTPQNLVALLAWHLRVLTSVRDALDHASGKPTPRELAQELKLHPFVVSKALQHIPFYSGARLAALYQELADLDIKLKSTRVSPQALFSVFLSRLTQPQLPKQR